MSTELTPTRAFLAVGTACLALLIILVNCITVVTVRRTTCLRTLSNMYVVSLALADIVVGFSMIPLAIFHIPEVRVRYLNSNPSLCALLMGMLVGMALLSAAHMALISLDRYLYIARPYLHRRVMTGSLTLCLLVSTWIFGIVHSLIPQAIYNQHAAICDITKLLPVGYTCYTTLVFYSIFVVTGAVMYGQIVRISLRQGRAVENTQAQYVNRSSNGNCDVINFDSDVNKAYLGTAVSANRKTQKRKFSNGRTEQKAVCDTSSSDEDKHTPKFSSQQHSVNGKQCRDTGRHRTYGTNSPILLAVHTVSSRITFTNVTEISNEDISTSCPTSNMMQSPQRTLTDIPAEQGSAEYFSQKSHDTKQESIIVTNINTNSVNNSNGTNYSRRLKVKDCSTEQSMYTPTCAGKESFGATNGISINTSDENSTNTSISGKVRRLSAGQRSIRFFMTVFGVYFLCLTPSVLCMSVDYFISLSPLLYNIFILLGFLNSGMNFFIFLILNSKFRDAVFKHVCRRQTPSQSGHESSFISS